MEMGGEDLERWIKGDGDGKNKLPPEKVPIIFSNMVEGVRFCHDNGYVHGDIQPKNFTLQLGGQEVVVLKLIDFGNAFNYTDSDTFTYPKCSLRYRPPEVFRAMVEEGPAYLGPPIDVWSLGIILYEMWNGDVRTNSLFEYNIPDDATGSIKLSSDILDTNGNVNNKMPGPFKELLINMLNIDAGKRITMDAGKRITDDMDDMDDIV